MTKILITRHDKIGDFVVSLPMFKVLKQQKKHIKVYALVSKINYEFAKSIDFIDGVILYDKENKNKTLADIKKENFDLSISAFIDTSLGWILLRSNIKTRIAPATKIAQVFFNKKISQRRSKVEKKEFEYNLDLLKAYDETLDLNYSYPLIEFTKKEKEKVFANFKSLYSFDENKKLFAFHPGSGGSTDGNLRLDDYVKLALKITSLALVQVVFTFGPDDKDLKDELEIKIEKSEDIFIYESKSSILDFCKLLGCFDLFVSTSTGPMHLAAINNIKTISFFGSNLFATPKRWASINEKDNQFNFILDENYESKDYLEIEKTLLTLSK
jgi:ADP-heptose:LPS heptosyltransferase